MKSSTHPSVYSLGLIVVVYVRQFLIIVVSVANGIAIYINKVWCVGGVYVVRAKRLCLGSML